MKKITLHIGNPKTGTSSIQGTLKANSSLLEGAGVLYPLEYLPAKSHRVLSRKNHRGLVLLTEPDRQLWTRTLRARIPESEKMAAIEIERKNFSRLLDKIERSPAPRVVISSESLGALRQENLHRLKDLFAPVAASFEVVCYYRNPVDAYLAKIQQHVKASGKLDRLSEAVRPISTIYENYSAVFGDSVQIRKFDRDTFVNGDVVDDFLRAVDVDDETISSLKKRHLNVSNPSETIAAQHWIRSRAFLDLEGAFFGANRELNRALRLAASEMSLNRPMLKPNVAQAVFFQNRNELRWLKTELGLEFDEIDYQCLENEPVFDLHSTKLSDFLEFDNDKVELLIAKTIRELCNSSNVKIN